MKQVIATIICIMMFSISIVAQNSTSDFEHHAYLIDNTLNCSAVETLGYNDYHGCKISNIYNFADSCYMEIGDE